MGLAASSHMQAPPQLPTQTQAPIVTTSPQHPHAKLNLAEQQQRRMDKRKVTCWYWMYDRCKFGNMCVHAHTLPQQLASGPLQQSQYEQQAALYAHLSQPQRPSQKLQQRMSAHGPLAQQETRQISQQQLMTPSQRQQPHQHWPRVIDAETQRPRHLPLPIGTPSLSVTRMPDAAVDRTPWARQPIQSRRCSDVGQSRASRNWPAYVDDIENDGESDPRMLDLLDKELRALTFK